MKNTFIGLLLTALPSFIYAQNVGIGTATPNPSAKLDVSSTNQGVLLPRVALTGTTDATTITNGNVTSLLVYNTATINDVSPGFYYWTGSIWQRIEIEQDADWYKSGGTQQPNNINDNIYTNGNVGIENNDPKTKLNIGSSHIYRNWMQYGTLYGDETDGMYVGLKDEGHDRKDAIIAWGDNKPGDNLRFLFSDYTASSPEEYMRITSEGRVGIGTQNPTQLFEVNGGSILRNTQGSYFWSERTDSDFDLVQNRNSTKRGLSIHPSPTGNSPLMVQYHDGSRHQTALRVMNTSGNVGIRTTNPTSALTVNGVAEIQKVGNTSSLYFTSRATDPGYIRHIVDNNEAEMRFVISDDVDAYSAVDYFSFGGETGSNFTEIMRINGARNVGIGTTSPAQRLHVAGSIQATSVINSSDSRYKRNSTTLSNSTAILQQLNPVQYYFKKGFKEGQFDERLHFGLLAQEVETQLPNLVHEDNEGYKGINYTELIPLLIKSNQEQQALIEKQQAQIEALQKSVEALQAQSK